jgi:hypothetical protein
MIYIPKIGDAIQYNPHALLEMEYHGYEFDAKHRKDRIKEYEVRVFSPHHSIDAHYLRADYDLYSIIEILSKKTGAMFTGDESLVIPLFIKTSILISDTYCSCNGPVKDVTVLGETFKYCMACKKERK